MTSLFSAHVLVYKTVAKLSRRNATRQIRENNLTIANDRVCVRNSCLFTVNDAKVERKLLESISAVIHAYYEGPRSFPLSCALHECAYRDVFWQI